MAGGPRAGWSAERAAAGTFGAALLVAGPLILWLNREQWFYLDEWAFLFKRDLGDPGTFLRPHWGHVVVLPAVLYQVLYRTVGLAHYWPYQVPVVAAHLLLATELRVFARRAGVGPWLATAAAGSFLFLGSGRENLAWGFQVTLTAALALGLGALLVADREHVSPRRTAGAASLAVAAVLCSNVGLVVVAVAGLALWLRWGRERALTVTVPALVAFAAWAVLAPPSEFEVPAAGPAQAASFAWSLAVAGVEGLVPHPAVAVVLVVGSVAGWALLANSGGIAWRGRHATAVALALGAVGLTGMIGLSRGAWYLSAPTTGRYVHLVAALALVPLAVGVDALVRGRGTSGLVAGCALLLVGLPGNARAIAPQGEVDRGRLGSAAFTTQLADLAARADLPPDLVVSDELTVGGLLDARARGELRAPSRADPEVRADATLYLALQVAGDATGPCRTVGVPGPVAVEAGEVLRSDSFLRIELLVGGERAGYFARSVSGDPPHHLAVRTGPHELWIEPVDDGATLEVCG